MVVVAVFGWPMCRKSLVKTTGSAKFSGLKEKAARSFLVNGRAALVKPNSSSAAGDQAAVISSAAASSTALKRRLTRRVPFTARSIMPLT